MKTLYILLVLAFSSTQLLALSALFEFDEKNKEYSAELDIIKTKTLLNMIQQSNQGRPILFIAKLLNEEPITLEMTDLISLESNLEVEAITHLALSSALKIEIRMNNFMEEIDIEIVLPEINYFLHGNLIDQSV